MYFSLGLPPRTTFIIRLERKISSIRELAMRLSPTAISVVETLWSKSISCMMAGSRMMSRWLDISTCLRPSSTCSSPLTSSEVDVFFRMERMTPAITLAWKPSMVSIERIRALRASSRPSPGPKRNVEIALSSGASATLFKAMEVSWSE